MILDLLAPERSEIPWKSATFPDGQPHCAVDPEAISRAAQQGRIDVLARLRSSEDIVRLALIVDSVRSALDLGDESSSPVSVCVHLSYLLGARMDRRIGPGQPDTLRVFAELLKESMARVDEIRILDPHSPVSLARFPEARAIYPDRFVSFALQHIEELDSSMPVVVIPDQGAIARTSGILERIGAAHSVAKCSKKRDPNTGALSGFQLESGDVRGRGVVIVDDICDGGGTFTGIAEVLRSHGAKSVHLAVTHGIFSRGIELAYIDRVYSTDSYGIPEATELPSAVEEAHGEVLRVYRRDDVVKLVVMTDFMRREIERRSER